MKEIYILGDITTESVAIISKEITQAIENKEDKILFKVNSGGGSVIAAMGLYDEICNLSVDTECLIFGMCASAATYISLACNKTKMYKSGTYMIHRCSGGVSGTLEEMENDLDYFEEIENKVIALYCAKTGKDREEILNMMNATTYMNSESALENGFIDEIVGKDSKLFNVADFDIINSIEVDEPKTLINKVIDIFKSDERKEEETLKNKLSKTENKILELTNEINAIKAANNAAIDELNNIIDEYKNKEKSLLEMIQDKEKDFSNRVTKEVNNRLMNLGVDFDLPEPSNKVKDMNFDDCKTINDIWRKLGY